MSGINVHPSLIQPSGGGVIPSEGIQGDEWNAYVTLLRTTRTNVGSPTGREPYGDGVPVVVVESRPTKEDGKAVQRAKGHR